MFKVISSIHKVYNAMLEVPGYMESSFRFTYKVYSAMLEIPGYMESSFRDTYRVGCLRWFCCNMVDTGGHLRG